MLLNEYIGFVFPQAHFFDRVPLVGFATLVLLCFFVPFTTLSTLCCIDCSGCKLKLKRISQGMLIFCN